MFLSTVLWSLRIAESEWDSGNMSSREHPKWQGLLWQGPQPSVKSELEGRRVGRVFSGHPVYASAATCTWSESSKEGNERCAILCTHQASAVSSVRVWPRVLQQVGLCFRLAVRANSRRMLPPSMIVVVCWRAFEQDSGNAKCKCIGIAGLSGDLLVNVSNQQPPAPKEEGSEFQR